MFNKFDNPEVQRFDCDKFIDFNNLQFDNLKIQRSKDSGIRILAKLTIT
jgi:hypothetical protein